MNSLFKKKKKKHSWFQQGPYYSQIIPHQRNKKNSERAGNLKQGTNGPVQTADASTATVSPASSPLFRAAGNFEELCQDGWGSSQPRVSAVLSNLTLAVE